MKRAEMIKNTKTYWVPWETIYEGNPQQIPELRYKRSSPRPTAPPATSARCAARRGYRVFPPSPSQRCSAPDAGRRGARPCNQRARLARSKRERAEWSANTPRT
jgi:hypothetical protein